MTAQKTWCEILGNDAYDSTMTDGTKIVRHHGNDRYTVLWTFDTHQQAMDALDAWRSEYGPRKTKEWALNRKLGDMPQLGERMICGHHVERGNDAFWVDHRGPMQFRDALAAIMVVIDEPIPQGFPCDI